MTWLSAAQPLCAWPWSARGSCRGSWRGMISY